MEFIRQYRQIIAAVAFVVLLGLASVIVVGEGDQAVIERMGKPERVVNRYTPDGPSGAGLVAKIPLIETAVWFPRGLVTWSDAGKRTRTADQQSLLIDTDVTYRVFDPVLLAKTLGSTARLGDQFKAQLGPLLDQELGQRDALSVIRPGAGGANAAMRGLLDERVRQYGVQVIDLRVARAGLDEGDQKLTFERMRQRHEEKLLDIEVASARDAQAVTGAAEAYATGLRQQAAAQDPEFYSFYRAMRSYYDMFGDPKRKNSTTINLPPDSGYLKRFGGN